MFEPVWACVMTVDAVWLVNRPRNTDVRRVAFLGNWPRTMSKPDVGEHGGHALGLLAGLAAVGADALAVVLGFGVAGE